MKTSNYESTYDRGVCPICGKRYEAEYTDVWYEDEYLNKELKCPHCDHKIVEVYRVEYCYTENMR